MACNIDLTQLNNRLKYEYIEDNSKQYTDPYIKIVENFNNYVKTSLQSTLAYKLYDIVTDNLDNIDNKLTEKFNVYKSTKNYLKHISELDSIQQLIHWFNNDKFAFRDFQHKALTIYQHASEERNKIDDTYIRELDYKIQKVFEPDEIKKLDFIYGRAGIFNILDTPYYSRILAKEDPKELIKEIKLSDYHKELANNIYLYYRGKKLNHTILNNINLYDSIKDESIRKDILTYATLKILSNVSDLNTLIDKLNNNKDIHDELVLASNSLQAMYKDMLTTTHSLDYATNNLISDIYEKNYIKQVVTKSDLDNHKYLERDGWKILREPTDTSLGIVYKENNIGKIEGVGTTLQYPMNDIIVPHELYEYYKNTDTFLLTNTKPNQTTALMSLTLEEKRKLGLIENPAHTLYRSLSKYKFIKDTQIIRDTLVSKGLTDNIMSDKDISDIINKIKNDEHPIFIKLPNNIHYRDMPEEIRKKYREVTRISNIGNMKDKVSLIRKDVVPWVQGYNKPKFANSPVLNKFMDVFQQLVVMGKIHNVVINPTKLLMDGVSNITLLMSRGVSLVQIAKDLPKINKELYELHKLKSELVYAKYQDILEPERNRTKEVEDKIKNHPLNFVHYNGMLTSLSTDIFMKNSDTISGLQANIDNLLEKIVKKSDSEDLNKFGNVIKWFMHVGETGGLTVDNLLYKLSNIGDRGIFKETLTELADNIKETRNNDDVIRFLSNFLNVPASNVTKFGSVTMQYQDVASRIILYKFLKSKGMNEQDAVQDVMDTFIDYRINMPKELQFASDMFIIPFPHYMLKVQKSIYNILKHRPATGSGILLYDLLHPYDYTNQLNIIGSNIIEKIEKNQLLGNPTSLMSIFI